MRQGNGYTAKKAVATPMSADAKVGASNAALARLGSALSGRGGGTADRSAGLANLRIKNLQTAVAKSRGGGQGKTSPIKKKAMGTSISKKGASTKAAAKKSSPKLKGMMR